MTILVTGCFGFIGSHVTARLLRAGHKVVGIDNLVSPSIDPSDRIKKEAGESWENFKFYELDIRHNLRSVFVNEAPEVVVHLAALGSVPRSFGNPREVFDVNCLGFINVVESCSLSKSVKRIVFASSSSVYGAIPPKVRAESYPCEPASPYALSKKQNEDFMRVWFMATGLEYVGLRFFNVYGPGQRTDSPYSAVIPKFITGDKLKVNGDGSQIRDFTYVDDVCDAIVLSIRTELKHGFFNVGTGKGTDIKQLATALANGREVSYLPERIGDVQASIASTDLAEKKLGFKSKVDVNSGLKQTIEFYVRLAEKETPTLPLGVS